MGEFQYGGQAVIEGVMMRGSKAVAVAVRAPSGDIVVRMEPLKAGIYTKPWGRWPLVRGLAMLWDALVLGMRALTFSADVALGEEDGAEFSGPMAWVTIAVSLAAGIALFFLLPSAIAKLLDHLIASDWLSSLVEGIVRVGIFIGYVAAIGQWEDIRRVFAYHGAEHKTINAYEAGVPLEPTAIQQYSTRHMRCGTSFLLVVLVLSVLIFAPFRFPQWHWRLLSRVVLIPLIAGISYELIKFASRHAENPLLRAVMAPGLALQALTTRPPDHGMIEVAIEALKAVLRAESAEQVQEEEYTVSVAGQTAAT
ncbi:MAG: DUF1385 domain-containing protein [Anaerolineae bacterium]